MYSIIYAEFNRVTSFDGAIVTPTAPESFAIGNLLSVIGPDEVFSVQQHESSSSMTEREVTVVSRTKIVSGLSSQMVPLILPPDPIAVWHEPQSFASDAQFRDASFETGPLS